MAGEAVLAVSGLVLSGSAPFGGLCSTVQRRLWLQALPGANPAWRVFLLAHLHRPRIHLLEAATSPQHTLINS